MSPYTGRQQNLFKKAAEEGPQLDNMGTVYNGYRKSNYFIIVKSWNKYLKSDVAQSEG